MKDQPQDNELREKILGLAEAVEIPNSAKDAKGTVLHVKLTDIEALLTQSRNDLLDKIIGELPEDISEHCWSDSKNRFVNYRPETVDGYNGALAEVRKLLEGYRGIR